MVLPTKNGVTIVSVSKVSVQEQFVVFIIFIRKLPDSLRSSPCGCCYDHRRYAVPVIIHIRNRQATFPSI